MTSKNSKNKAVNKSRKRKCLMCDSEVTTLFFPFCSKACEELDLNRWLSGAYAIPSVEEDLPDDDDIAEKLVDGNSIASKSV